MNKRQRKKYTKKYQAEQLKIAVVPFISGHGLKDGDVFDPLSVIDLRSLMTPELLTIEEFKRRYPS